MSRSDAYIKVNCDYGEKKGDCENELEIQLTALAGGGYDERDVDKALKRYGWTRDGDEDYCDECSEFESQCDEGDD